jgi:hypothetical protein
MSDSATTQGPTVVCGVPGEQRLAVLRTVTENLTGRGRVLGPSGSWVRLDFDDLRGQLQTG